MIFEGAHALGALPLLWLLVLHYRYERRGPEWWWIAVAFGVSFLADTLAEVLDPMVVGNTYTVTQAALIGMVLLSRAEAATFLVVLALTAGAAALFTDPTAPDVLVASVAWLGVTGIAGLTIARPRSALTAYFGLGWLAWLVYAAAFHRYLVDGVWYGPDWPWLGYQSTRLAGTGLFCLAAARPRVRLTLHRRMKAA